MDLDTFYTDKKDAFSKIPGYVWTRPEMLPTFLDCCSGVKVIKENSHSCHKCQNKSQITIANLRNDEKFKDHGS